MEESAIVALEQAETNIAGLMFIAVLLPDGQRGLVFSLLCEALGLNYHKQRHLLRSHPELASALVLVKIQTAGGPQSVNVLVSWGIPLWLNGIRSGGRSPEQRKRLFIMRREAISVLARLFQPPAAAEPYAPPIEEIVEALPPGPDPVLEQLEEYRREVGQYRQEIELYRRQLHMAQRLLSAAIERILLYGGQMEHLEDLYRKWLSAQQPKRTGRRGRRKPD